jgi:leucyl aminopeptidase
MVVYFVRQNGKKAPLCAEPKSQDDIDRAFAAGDFSGKEGRSLLFYPGTGRACGAKRVMVVGLGQEELNGEIFRAAGGMVARAVVGHSRAAKVMAVIPEELDFLVKEMSKCLTEGLVLGDYQFNKYRKVAKDDEPPKRIESLTLAAASDRAARQGMMLGHCAAEAACQARDMANEPGNKWRPDDFARYGRKLAKGFGLGCQVLGSAELKKLKMGGLLGVNQGTAEQPKLVILEHRTGRKVPTLMLVGKGLTFDSGGISLKPSFGMQEMKYDMCGGAAVMAVMRAVAQEKPAGIDVVALVPTTDNMPGPEALKPGDVVRQYNGKTVEIISTDAEGRLILADALSYGVKRFKPAAVVDIATLTGAVIIGLGHHLTGLMSNDDELAARLTEAGERSAEPVWRLPLNKDYAKQIKSEVADLKNVGGREAGTITAGAFLQEFIGETKWAHLDIAGTAWDFTEKTYIPKKGPSAVGVRLLIELIRHWER